MHLNLETTEEIEAALDDMAREEGISVEEYTLRLLVRAVIMNGSLYSRRLLMVRNLFPVSQRLLAPDPAYSLLGQMFSMTEAVDNAYEVQETSCNFSLS